jgi:translation initiation factor IF-1
MSAVANRTAKKKASNSGSAKEQPIKLQGTVSQVLPNTLFRVALPNGHVVLAYLGSELRQHFIRISAGDKVELEMSPYDLTKGRIVYRL